MSLNAAALKLMADKGLSLEDVVEIAAAMETRSAAAERQQRYRDRRKAEHNERDVTRDVTPPLKERDQNPPDEKPTPDGVVKKRARPRSAEFEVPDWVPAKPWAAFAEMRRRKKKPLDDYTAKQLFGRLRSIRDAGWDLEDVINKAAIACHDGFWMPDGRDPNVRRASAPTAASSPDDLEQRAAWFAEKGRDDEAARLRAQAARLRAGPDPPRRGGVQPIGQLVGRINQAGAG